LKRWIRYVLVLLAGGGIGWISRGFFPPFVLDDPFWRDFFTGPPAGGLFALAGAVIAFLAANIAARVSRRSAERQEWWDRAEWALNLAMSDKGSDRDIGLAAIEVILTDATTTEAAMVNAVTSLLLPEPTDVDTAATPSAE
jgi:hypothetical protein